MADIKEEYGKIAFKGWDDWLLKRLPPDSSKAYVRQALAEFAKEYADSLKPTEEGIEAIICNTYLPDSKYSGAKCTTCGRPRGMHPTGS